VIRCYWDNCGAHTFPYIESKNPSAQIEHEATTSKIDSSFYCNQRESLPKSNCAYRKRFCARCLTNYQWVCCWSKNC
jgi:hypothetical protein